MFRADQDPNTRPGVLRNGLVKTVSRSVSVFVGLSVSRWVPSIRRTPGGGSADQHGLSTVKAE
jgi:hypothetical protein